MNLSQILADVRGLIQAHGDIPALVEIPAESGGCSLSVVSEVAYEDRPDYGPSVCFLGSDCGFTGLQQLSEVIEAAIREHGDVPGLIEIPSDKDEWVLAPTEELAYENRPGRGPSVCFLC